MFPQVLPVSDHEGSAQRERLELPEGVSLKCNAHSAAGWRPFEVLVTVAPGLHSVTPILSFTSDQCSLSAGLVWSRYVDGERLQIRFITCWLSGTVWGRGPYQPLPLTSDL